MYAAQYALQTLYEISLAYVVPVACVLLFSLLFPAPTASVFWNILWAYALVVFVFKAFYLITMIMHEHFHRRHNVISLEILLVAYGSLLLVSHRLSQVPLSWWWLVVPAIALALYRVFRNMRRYRELTE
ncbi:hypothetical protein GF342_04670 [Candidatus Woesearchaeota archaeon]|nr:hypothetical protein [Candidatus Woesearchaeota archaeon]